MNIMSISEIMDRAIDILKKYIKSIVLFNLGYGAIKVVCYVVLSIIIVSVMVGSMIGGGNNTGSIIFFVVSLLILVLTFTFSSSVGMINIVSQEFFDYKVSASEAIGSSFKSIPKVFGLIFLALIIFSPILAGFVGIIYLIDKSITNPSIVFNNTFDKVINFSSLDTFNGLSNRGIMWIIALIIIVIVILVVMAIYSIFVLFSLHAVVIENKGIVESLKRGMKLIKNERFKIFWYYIIFYLAVSAITLSIQSFIGLITSLIFIIMKYLNVDLEYMALINQVLTIFNWPLNLLTALIISPIKNIMFTLLYFNQRFKKEGYDLTLRLKQIQRNDLYKHINEAGETNADN